MRISSFPRAERDRPTDGNEFGLENRRAQGCRDEPRAVVPVTWTKSECSPWCGETDWPERGEGQEEDSAGHAAERVDQRRAARNRVGDVRCAGATRVHRQHAKIGRDMLRLMRISRLVDRKLGCQLVRRETGLVRRAFLVPVLERN